MAQTWLQDVGTGDVSSVPTFGGVQLVRSEERTMLSHRSRVERASMNGVQSNQSRTLRQRESLLEMMMGTPCLR